MPALLKQDTTRPAVELVNGKSHATTAAELKPYKVLPHEAACPCCGVIWISFAVLRRFKRVRDAYGFPLTITSGYRCHASQVWIWNKASAAERAAGLVATPGNSPHEHGEALDIPHPSNFRNAKAWGEFINKANAGDVRVGCLKYRGFAHMDTMFLLSPAKGKGILW